MNRGTGKPGALLAVVLCLVMATGLPAPAYADGAKAAAAMAQQAIRAYEAGDHVRAAQLYVNAWRTDPKTPAYLYAAARAEHASDQLERAEAHYREFIGVAGANAAMVAKANGFMRDLREAQAGAKERDGDRAARGENWKLAAQLFLDAYELAPNRATLLFRAAVANESSGDLALAESQFRSYLRASDPSAKAYKEAEIHLEQLARKPQAKQEAAKPVPPPEAVVAPQTTPTPAPAVVAKPLPPAESVVVARPVPQPLIAAPVPVVSPPSRIPAWSALGGGVALGIGAGVLYALAGGQRSDLDKALKTRAATGEIIGISRASALQEKSSIESKETMSIVLGSLGVAAVGVGAWLWLRHPRGQVAVLPGPGDVGISVAFER